MLFSEDDLAILPQILSPPRFQIYLDACGHDVRKALQLYQWNAEAASAFLVPIGLCEISIRNAAAAVLDIVHGTDWPRSQGFVRSLPSPCRGEYNARSDLLEQVYRHRTVPAIVSNLRFAFWENLLTRSQEERLWTPHLRRVFLGVEPTATVSETRARLLKQVRQIRLFRNRIAHHEPIFRRDLIDELSVMVSVLRTRHRLAAEWLSRIEKLTEMMRRMPLSRAAGEA